MRPKSDTLTGQELEIMKVIWPLGQATVREVYDALRARRTVAYTTVQTMMNILETKGHLKKEPGEKAQIYAPVRPQRLVVQIDGARVRQSRLRRLGPAAAGAPAQGKGPDRTRAHASCRSCSTRRSE